MKSVLRNSFFAVVALLVASISGNVMANGGTDPKSTIDVKFVGTKESRPVFQLTLSNTSNDEFYITISDTQGNVLYSDKVKGSTITKNFAIETQEVGDNVLRLDIRSKNTGKKESYNINSKQSYIEESVVTKVN